MFDGDGNTPVLTGLRLYVERGEFRVLGLREHRLHGFVNITRARPSGRLAAQWESVMQTVICFSLLAGLGSFGEDGLYGRVDVFVL